MRNLLVYTLLFACLQVFALAMDAPPNIIVMMVDDMGFSGPSIAPYGNPHYKTPGTDRLAAEGMLFTDFHSSGTVCSPTRAGLLTGRYQQRAGIEAVIHPAGEHPEHRKGLQKSEVTFAELFKHAGYATGVVGKWHLGYPEENADYHPQNHGFDYFKGYHSGNIDYINHWGDHMEHAWWHGRKETVEEGYTTHLINRYALEFIEENQDKPFCLYIAHESPHSPIQGPGDPIQRGPGAEKRLTPKDEAMKQMILEMDKGVEQVRAKLVELGLEKNTLFLFFSDNGDAPSTATGHPSHRGQSWTPVNNGGTTPDAMAVRSVAVHPENSSIVLRAGGNIVNGKLISGLWRSKDAGKSWKLVTGEIDFDGRGPTTLFGEVIQFYHYDPNIVVAGGETTGLFISHDAGETWQYNALKGERITTLATYLKDDWMIDGSRAVPLVVGTFADSELERLGLPKPASQVEAPGRIYWFTFSQKDDHKLSKPKKTFELEEFGVANMHMDKHPNFVHLATSRGVYYTWVHGASYVKRKVGTSADRLFTAIGARAMHDPWSNYTCAAPFSSKEQSPVSFSDARSRNWTILSDKTQIEGDEMDLRLNAGITCILPSSDEERTIFLCNRFGIFQTKDGGKSYKLMLQTSSNGSVIACSDPVKADRSEPCRGDGDRNQWRRK